MNLIGCLDVPTSGRYLIDGVDVSGLDDDALADIRNQKIGFVFQTFNLIPRADVFKNVELPLVYAGIAAAKRSHLSEEAIERNIDELVKKGGLYASLFELQASGYR